MTNKDILIIDDDADLAAITADMLTDKIAGLNIGGDDYISKHYSLGELLSRVKAHLRRSYSMNDSERFTFGDIEVDLMARNVVKNGAPIELSAKEFDLLALLIRNKNKASTRKCCSIRFGVRTVTPKRWKTSGLPLYTAISTQMLHLAVDTVVTQKQQVFCRLLYIENTRPLLVTKATLSRV